MYQNAMYYLRFYRDYALKAWADIGPETYGILLLSIGIVGWLLMKNSAR